MENQDQNNPNQNNVEKLHTDAEGFIVTESGRYFDFIHYLYRKVELNYEIWRKYDLSLEVVTKFDPVFREDPTKIAVGRLRQMGIPI